jgi:hypothetical protein
MGPLEMSLHEDFTRDEASAAGRWPPIAIFITQEGKLGRWAARHGRGVSGLYEFLRFGIKQGWACLFGGAMVGLLIGSHLFYPPDAPPICADWCGRDFVQAL